MKINTVLLIISLVILITCKPKNEKDMQTVKKATITKESFGKTDSGQEVYLWTIENKKGIKMKVSNYGGIITELYTPDKSGKFEDIVLGYNRLNDYIKETPYFGALIGRYANRIAKGQFKLDGKKYLLKQNNNGNHLHGGLKGFDKVVWKAEEINDPNKTGLKLKYLSKDGEEGYPGNLNVTVEYILDDNNQLVINYNATTDKATPVNLTHHSYFNLTGSAKADVLGHKVIINADRYTVVDKNLIPTGVLAKTAGTAFDFTEFHTIGERIAEVDGGYDHNFVLNTNTDKLSLAAKVIEPVSGRTLEVYTTEPGLQFYSGNFLDGSITGKNDIKYNKHYGFCMETQHFPDSPNHPKFPAVILKPGDVYKHTCIYKFSVE
ncbi:MAG: galactose mutarotase [Bacteroidales bacterium]|nr:galactose mutarotase [Bacteroidales bacterium]